MMGLLGSFFCSFLYKKKQAPNLEQLPYVCVCVISLLECSALNNTSAEPAEPQVAPSTGLWEPLPPADPQRAFAGSSICLNQGMFVERYLGIPNTIQGVFLPNAWSVSVDRL